MSTPSSFTPPNPSSRSSSPSSNPQSQSQPQGNQSRVVSGSLRDRIAKFNNPSAAPLVPTHPFGLSGPPAAATSVRGGLIGNRLPGLDPKTAGLVGGLRKVSETRGMIGNRIPSVGSAPAPKASSTGANTAIGAVVGGRSASPAGSVDSSTASASASGAAGTSNSPSTSRSSSPPTSPGAGLPHSLLAATLPDQGGPGSMTPSSTIAEAGEPTTDLSVPSTPVASATDLPPGEYDLVPGNLKLASAQLHSQAQNQGQTQMSRGLSVSSIPPSSFAPSVSSSLVSQYDPSPSAQDADEKQMMDDVSGISTPMGTPRAAARELGEGDSLKDDRSVRDDRSMPSGSMRGEGSVLGEGSVRGEGSVMGDGEDEQNKERNGDVDELTEGWGKLGIEDGDRETTPEPPKDENMETTPEPIKDKDEVGGMREENEEAKTPELVKQHLTGPASEDKAEKVNEPGTQAKSSGEEAINLVSPAISNRAQDLDPLKTGDLEHPSFNNQAGESLQAHTMENPVDVLAGEGLKQNLDEQVVLPEEQLVQRGSGGERMEDVETADEVVLPPGEEQEEKGEEGEGEGLEVEGLEVEVTRWPAPAPGEVTAALSPPDAEANESEAPTQAEDKRDQPMDGSAGDDQHRATIEPIPAETSDAQRDAQKVEEASSITAISAAIDARTGENAGESGLFSDDRLRVPPVHEGDFAEMETTLEEIKDQTPKFVVGDVRDQDIRPVQGVLEDGSTVMLPHDPRANAAAPRTETTEKEGDEVERRKSVQAQIKPASIAQAAEDVPSSPPQLGDDELKSSLILQTKDEAAEISPPDFPEPPHNELDPPSTTTPTETESEMTADCGISAASTPVDPTFLKSFPEVPDEERPRVEVHVTPHATPGKQRQGSVGQLGSPSAPNTVAELEPRSKEPVIPDVPMVRAEGAVRAAELVIPSTEAETESSPMVATTTTVGEADEGGNSQSTSASAGLSPKSNESPGQPLKKRLSHKVPKSPLLDDEDPGDFEGEGWAVVTKGRDS